MGTIQDQKKLTEGKGWKNEKIFPRESPYKAIQDAVKTVVQKIKYKKKRGPLDE